MSTFLVTYHGENGAISYDDVALEKGEDVDVGTAENAASMLARYPHAFGVKTPVAPELLEKYFKKYGTKPADPVEEPDEGALADLAPFDQTNPEDEE